MLKNLARTALYMRLSRDDEKAGESMSIERQRIILRSYVRENGGEIAEEYVDDGWSGTNFDRPDVKRMLNDARAGKIDTIIVKDLSRFGRNYIQVGQYIDYIFPAYGIRFIALNDNVDTADRSSAAMDMMPIMNVFNEWHAANTSKKIRAVLDASRRTGRYTNWSYPYGYKAGGDENRTAVIDEYAAAVVRRIFDLRLQGNSFRSIAKILTDDGIENPATYFTRADGNKSERKCAPYWVPKTVMSILKDPTYTGSTVQHRTTSVSYKNHKVVTVPENERIVKENAHAPIIERSVWDKVQALNKSVSGGRADKNNTVRPLSGMLVCESCGKKLKVKSYASGNCFLCRTYIDLGKKYCSSHRIAEKQIESIVLQDIRSASCVKADEEKLKERFIRCMAKRDNQSRYSYQRQLNEHNTRLCELDKLIQSVFEKSVLSDMPESVCKSLLEKYRNERQTLEKEADRIRKKIDEGGGKEFTAEQYLERLKVFLRCESLTREMCLQLVESVTVGEKNADGGRDIHIYYKCKSEACLSPQNTYFAEGKSFTVTRHFKGGENIDKLIYGLAVNMADREAGLL